MADVPVTGIPLPLHSQEAGGCNLSSPLSIVDTGVGGRYLREGFQGEL